jgi:hypothetical protein
MADIPSHSLLGPSGGLKSLTAFLKSAKDSPKETPNVSSSATMELIVRDGSFDVPVFIGNAKSSASIAASIATAGQGGGIVCSKFLNNFLWGCI